MFTHIIDWHPPASIPFSKLREVCEVLGIPNGLRVTAIELGTREVKITRYATNALRQLIVSQDHIAQIVTTIPISADPPVSLVKKVA